MNTRDVKNLPVIFESPAMTARKDALSGVVWNELHPQPRPCMTIELLRNFRQLHAEAYNGEHQVDWWVTWSSHPAAFSLGGDLELFRSCVLTQDWQTLQEYADLCVDAIYAHVSGFGRGVTSIAVVQGPALGGGLEAALAMDYLIAEPGAEFGLPEILFNLFPGMGAYSLLVRKIGPQKARAFVLDGQIHGPEIMQEFGLVDLMAPRGEGLEATARFISRWHKQRHGLRAFSQAIRSVTTGTTRAELTAIVRQWVEAVRGLNPRDLRMMDLLVKAQCKLQPAVSCPASAESRNPFAVFPTRSLSPFGVRRIPVPRTREVPPRIAGKVG